MKIKTQHYHVDPGAKHPLDHIASDDDGGLDKDRAKEESAKCHDRLVELQELLYSEGTHALLAVFQAMDTGGKDGTIRQVFAGCSPASVRVTSFKAPNTTELAHDFLWRIHQNTPRKGMIGIFNRSHYEDVLIARVKSLAPKSVWKKRFEHINDFEKMLHDEGTRIVKFYLHISKDYQKERLERRLEDPHKYWKFDPSDLAERGRWDLYMEAYEDVLSRCSTDHAPWYVIPAERHWFRDLLITSVLIETLESLQMHYPKPTFDPRKIVVK